MLAAAAAIAGCGGGGNERESGPTPADWARQADGVCASAQEELEKVEAPGALDEVPAYVEATAPIVQEELTKLRAIPRPTDHDRIDAYIQKVEETLESARAVGAAAADGNAARARTEGQETQRLTAEAADLAGDLGAKTCASQ
jgi:hypothetical protein